MEDLISSTPAQFAADVAAAEGADVALSAPLSGGPQPLCEWGRIVLAGLGGLVAGALTAAVAIYPVGFWFADTVLAAHPDPWPFVILVDLIAAASAIASGGGAVRLAVGATPRRRRIALTAMAALAVSSAGALVPTWLFALDSGFSTAPVVVAIEVARSSTRRNHGQP